jgi:hypothetical protein
MTRFPKLNDAQAHVRPTGSPHQATSVSAMNQAARSTRKNFLRVLTWACARMLPDA